MADAIFLNRITSKIKDISAAVVTLASSSFTYDGTQKTQQVESVVLGGKTLVAGTDYTVTGNTATNAGTHTLTISGVGKYNGAVTKQWTISKLGIAKPTVTGSFTYDGSAKTATVSGYNSAYMSQSGTTSSTNAGTYTITFTLSDTTNTQWSDGTTAAVERTWSIAKATGKISVSPTSLTISGAAGTTSTATITYTGDGSIRVSSNKTSVATVSRSGNTVTVKSVANGSATITITLAAGTNYTGASCTIAVTVSIPSYNTTLANNTWEQIAEACAAGVAANYWKIGDTKTEKLNGKDYTFRIAGFDHDDLNSADAKYSDSSYNGGKKKAAITFEMAEIFTTTYYMNSSNTNQGGWNSSEMRSTVMQTMKGYMPTALQNVLRTVSKLASKGNENSTILTSADELFLLSEIEVKGTASYSFAGEGSQYAYYKAGNSCIKNNSGSADMWWLRSPYSDHYYYFVAVGSGGALDDVNASVFRGVSFGFCI